MQRSRREGQRELSERANDRKAWTPRVHPTADQDLAASFLRAAAAWARWREREAWGVR